MVFGLIMDPGDDRPAGFAVTSWVQFECRFLYSNGSSTDYRGVFDFLLLSIHSLLISVLSLSFSLALRPLVFLWPKKLCGPFLDQ